MHEQDEIQLNDSDLEFEEYTPEYSGYVLDDSSQFGYIASIVIGGVLILAAEIVLFIH